MTNLKRISLLLALGACLAAAGCGSDDEEGKGIPADQAAQLANQLDIVQARLDNGSEGACKDILEAEDANDDAVYDHSELAAQRRRPGRPRRDGAELRQPLEPRPERVRGPEAGGAS